MIFQVAWNYQQFSVRYESLRDEMQVGPIYVRHFLDAGDSFLRALENPSHVVLFEKLFRRVLVNVDSNASVSILCTKCLSRLYAVCKDIIGGFDDVLLIVRMLEQANNMELQHCLLDLLEAMSAETSNLHQLLDRHVVDTLIKYLSLAHLNPDQIGNVLARATSNVLMLKDGPSSQGASEPKVTVASGGFGEPEYDLSEEDKGRLHTRSQWVPDDIACPRSWFIAPKGTIPPPTQAQKGPFRVTDLLAKVDRGEVDGMWLVAPATSDDVDEERFEAVVDTGRWRTMGDYFQLKLQMLFPGITTDEILGHFHFPTAGKSVYSPAEIATKALAMLTAIASVHRSANSQRIPFYPIPTSKLIMSGPEHLYVFAQSLLANDANVVVMSARILRSLVQYNMQANSKLYLTGAFFFACRYAGNNYIELAKLFDVAHLRQSFHDSASSVARDQPIGVKSILGALLPAAVITILVNYGAERFASVFTGEFDTPEVIWNATLRRHVVEMIDQHIGEFPARLRQFTLARWVMTLPGY